jgi:phage terminase large subunit-like protein
MSYDQGWKRFQAETLDYNWNDEEPPIKIYSENLTRSNAGELGPFSFTTFTPLNGMTETVLKFFSTDPSIRAKNGHLTLMGLNDVDHYTPQRKAEILASYLPHEREARANGVPILGSGRVFTKAYEDVECEPFDIPRHWPVLAAIDIGGGSISSHPAAAVKLAYDRDTDTIYLVRSWRERNVTLADQASAVRQFGEKIPVAWPQDTLQHDRKSGQSYKVELEREGLNMLGHYSRYPDSMDNGKQVIGSNSVESGVIDMLQRFAQGRMKIFRGQDKVREEYEMYHRKDGLIEKINDDLLSAARYGVMMIRYAELPAATWATGGAENINERLDDAWIM